jgi:hypothetical protein
MKIDEKLVNSLNWMIVGIVHYSLALKCTALLHEASDFFSLRSFSLHMEASNSYKIQVHQNQIQSHLNFLTLKKVA